MLAGTTDDPELLAALSEARRTARATIASLRNLTFELHPPMLDREGLAGALRVHLEQMRQDLGTQFVLESEVTGPPSPGTSAIAYRIAQEALTNIRKHARAQHVTVGLRGDEHALVVRIADDGRGFQGGPDEPDTWPRVDARARRDGRRLVPARVGRRRGNRRRVSLPALAAA